jgi:hypothetical protein
MKEQGQLFGTERFALTPSPAGRRVRPMRDPPEERAPRSNGSGYARVLLGPGVLEEDLDRVLLAAAEAETYSDTWRDQPEPIKRAFVDLYGHRTCDPHQVLTREESAAVKLALKSP